MKVSRSIQTESFDKTGKIEGCRQKGVRRTPDRTGVVEASVLACTRQPLDCGARSRPGEAGSGDISPSVAGTWSQRGCKSADCGLAAPSGITRGDELVGASWGTMASNSALGRRLTCSVPVGRSQNSLPALAGRLLCVPEGGQGRWTALSVQSQRIQQFVEKTALSVKVRGSSKMQRISDGQSLRRTVSASCRPKQPLTGHVITYTVLRHCSGAASFVQITRSLQ